MTWRVTRFGWLAAVVWMGLSCRPPGPDPPMIRGSPSLARRADGPKVGAVQRLPPRLPRPLADDPMAVTVDRLSNGLTVFISRSDHEPRVHARIVVRAGSRHEPSNSTGLAHYLEHMLFKGTDELGTLDFASERPYINRIAALYRRLGKVDGTERRSLLAEIDRTTVAGARFAVPNELDRLYTTLGIADLNAYTGDEQTVYTADVPANRVEAWARVESERFADPVFRLFLSELETVYEEKNLSLDSGDDRLLETVLRLLFPRDPYGTHPTLGRVEHLKTPAYDDMVDYFRRWYVPNNMAIVLAGNVVRERVLPILEREFGRWKPGETPAVPPYGKQGWAGRRFAQVPALEEETTVIAWPTVGIEHDDIPALEVMDWMVDNSQTGLLNLELELTQKVPSARSWLGAYNEAGYWALAATARKGQRPAAVETLLMETVSKLKRGHFTQADLDAIILQHGIDRRLQLESNVGRAIRMTDAYASGLPWPRVIARDVQRERVTRKDVLRVARKYLGADRVVVHRTKGTPHYPKIAKPQITPVDLDSARTSDFARRIEAMATDRLDPLWVVEGRDFRRSSTVSGPLISVHNPRNELFSVSYRFHWGYRDEPFLCFALDLLEVSGTGAIAPQALRRQFFGLGTSVSVHCNAEQVQIDVSGIDKNMEESLDLVRRWLTSPEFAPEALQRLVRNTLSRRRDHLTSPALLSRALSDFANFGPDSAWHRHPSNAEVLQVREDELARAVRRLSQRGHRILYFGPRREVSGLGLGDGELGARAPRPRRYREVRATTVWFLHAEVTRSAIEILFPGPALARSRRPTADLYSEYLGGNMSALVPQEIREARGWAYAASAYFTVGRTRDDQAALLGRIDTQADKTVDALRLFLDLVAPQRAIEVDRLRVAWEARDQSFRTTRIDPRMLSKVVDRWDMLGESQDPRPWLWTSMQALTPEVLQQFAADATRSPAIVSILGDRNRIDLAALRQVGPVVTVNEDDLFSYGAFPELP